jgi:cyclopropane fatty-acyl-phospholipid synthase-like methyltransferase
MIRPRPSDVSNDHGPATPLRAALAERFETDAWGVFVSEQQGYWSNISQEDNRALVEMLASTSPRDAIRATHPELEEIIYSPKRAAGLELLGLQGHETCVDFGCMWGALTVPLAKLSAEVIAIDQTLASLRFLAARARDEGLTNTILLCHDIRTLPELPSKADVAVVNGVLEWIAEEEPIELKAYYGKRQSRAFAPRPGLLQRQFLQKVRDTLRPGGRLYLAIENRYDFKMFFGARDPHVGLPFTTVLPRRAADWVSRAALGRPYVTWVYSFSGLRRLLQEVGFTRIDLYKCCPDYRFPERITPYDQRLVGYRPTIGRVNAVGHPTLKRRAARAVEGVLMSVLQAKSLSPSIIALARK